MFTGIIECLGTILSIDSQGNDNMVFTLRASFVDDLILGQSISHDGVCLTVTNIDFGQKTYKVEAIGETLQRTNLGNLTEGDFVNLERCMVANGRFDGHIVQGHVDQTGKCLEVVEKKGSWHYKIGHSPENGNITVEKGSISINGVSLTVVTSEKDNFTVAIIPYTKENTTFKFLQKGMTVNLEFDIVGKYLYKLTKNIT